MPRKKSPADELPIGFSMALAQNGPAMANFAGLDQLQREEIISRARAAKSKSEMRSIVAELSENPSVF